VFHPSYSTSKSQSLLCVPATVNGLVNADPGWLAATLAKAKGARKITEDESEVRGDGDSIVVKIDI